MKITKASSIVLAALSFIISSCSHNNSSGTNCINTFPCVANAHRLHYSISPSAFIQDTSQDITYTSTGTSDVYMSTSVSNMGTLNYTEYVYPCNNKLFEGASISAAQTTTNYELESGAAINTTWTETISGTTSTYTVIGKNIPVTVPAGTYSCDQVTYFQSGTINVDTIYMNAAVGYVAYSGVFLSYQLEYKNF